MRLLFFMITAIIALSGRSDEQPNIQEKMFGEYEYVKKLPDVKLLKNGMNGADVFKMLGKETSYGQCIDDNELLPKTKSKEMFASGNWKLYSIENFRPRFLDVCVDFSRIMPFNEKCIFPFRDVTIVERKPWIVTDIRYKSYSYENNRTGYEEFFIKKKKKQDIPQYTAISPISYKIINADNIDKDLVYIEFKVKIQNKLDSTINLVLSYSVEGSKNSPGFTLPLGTNLEYCRKGYNEGWVVAGAPYELVASLPKVTVPANGSSIMSCSMRIRKNDMQYLNNPLRIKLWFYSIAGGDFNRKILRKYINHYSRWSGLGFQERSIVRAFSLVFRVEFCVPIQI